MIKLFWHEPSNVLAVAELYNGCLPKLTMIDDEYSWLPNAFICYPLDILKSFGWVDLGEL